MVELNSSQKKRILISLARLDRSLAEIEAQIATADTESLLRVVHNDLVPAQVDMIRGRTAEARAQIEHAIQLLQIPNQVRHTSVSRHLEMLLTANSILISELSPSRLRGYGRVDSETAERITQVQQSLLRPVGSLQELVAQIRQHREGGDV